MVKRVIRGSPRAVPTEEKTATGLTYGAELDEQMTADEREKWHGLLAGEIACPTCGDPVAASIPGYWEFGDKFDGPVKFQFFEYWNFDKVEVACLAGHVVTDPGIRERVFMAVVRRSPNRDVVPFGVCRGCGEVLALPPLELLDPDGAWRCPLCEARNEG